MKYFFLFFIFLTGGIAQAQYIYTIAGDDTEGFSGDGGPAIAAKLREPRMARPDRAGNVYISDADNVRIRKVNNAGIITTIAGGGTYLTDGVPATAEQIGGPTGLIFDGAGNIYFGETIIGGHGGSVRKIDTAGILTTVAGGGAAPPGSGDGGPATAAGFAPADIAMDKTGNMYIADLGANEVRKIDTAGIITTIAGNYAAGSGFSGDGGPATLAQLHEPEGVAVDGYGNVYIADYVNYRIRKVDTAGIITTIAGTGTGGYNSDGIPATTAELWYPWSVATDSIGGIYIADAHNERIRKINTAGIITTIAGDSTYGYAGDDGPATAAELWYPVGVSLDDSGNVYITDQANNNIRKVSAHLPHTSGIAAVSATDKAALGIYPDPNEGAFTLLLSAATTAPVQITITNMMGQKIKEASTMTNENTAIQLSAPPGLYFITATTPQGVYSGKVVVE